MKIVPRDSISDVLYIPILVMPCVMSGVMTILKLLDIHEHEHERAVVDVHDWSASYGVLTQIRVRFREIEFDFQKLLMEKNK